ncbi:DUF5320 domain-containing protein [Halarsenatibacter silvermanii]|uniref:DUF5320 domain-containing protein n=1 Tax=Halarsenatibacter silvermanii TaxID=321763 RepID=A0A1G9S2C5_9FIRM|nr:DUF5320 domain-containing protein [Halarsenatibacter silvermanii]SDM29621.1 hypothetical protein SAMN04488692_12520 [Halarsenatibacter silvermanii]
MPRGDGTGPDGLGEMTGRGAGYCAGFNVPGYVNSGAGQGLGLARGFRGGRGGRRRGTAGRGTAGPAGPPAGRVRKSPFVSTQLTEEEAKKTELKNLKRTAEDLEDQLDAVRDRIEQLREETD